MARRSSAQWVIGETENIQDHYKFGRTLGQPGQYGRAVVGTKINPQAGEPKEFAIKIISKARFIQMSSSRAKAVFASFRSEVKVMSELRHQNIIKFFEAYEEKLNFYIVMELCTGGELFDRIQEVQRFSEHDASQILRSIFEGLAYMHSKKIAHCDLKPDNFIFASPARDAPIKIIDFGMSKVVKPRNYFRTFCGTPYYVAPEVLEGKYTQACDMWSMGVVMFVLLHGYPPFHADQAVYGDETDDRIYSLIMEGFNPVIKRGYKNHFPQAFPISAAARDLITKLLEKDTNKRLTAQEALEHPWMTGEGAPDKPIHTSVLLSLKQFVKVNRFKANVLDVMADSLSDEEIQRLRQSFKAMDNNGDGVLTFDEFKQGLETFRRADGAPDSPLRRLSQEEIVEMFSRADIDEDGTISYDELMKAMVNRKLMANEERVWAAFCKLDKDGNGHVTTDELKEVLRNKYSPEELETMIREVDVDGSHTVDYTEFLRIFSEEEEKKGPAGVSAKPGDDDERHPIGQEFHNAGAPDSGDAPARATATAPKKKRGGLFSCCAGPPEEEDDGTRV